jgi:hypothetical protein
VLAHVTGDRAGVEVVTAARGKADDDADGFSLEERFLSAAKLAPCAAQQNSGKGEREAKGSLSHDASRKTKMLSSAVK